MVEPHFIHSLTLAGFRAYLQPQTFDLSKKRSLAIFAPNGLGKSSVIEALEYIFDENGTIERLGQRKINNFAGPDALAHDAARDESITPVVEFSIRAGHTVSNGSRLASGRSRPLDPVAATIIDLLEVSPIIRGYTLRNFVESQSPEERYGDVARWLQLGPLVEIQKNLRSLRKHLNSTVGGANEISKLNNLLKEETGHKVLQWEEDEILRYANDEIVKPLNASIKFSKFHKDDPAYMQMQESKNAEDKQTGLAVLKQLKGEVDTIFQQTKPESGKQPIVSGVIHEYDNAVSDFTTAKKREAAEHDKASHVEFREIWSAAQKIFSKDEGTPKTCPVCDTEIDKTAAGSAHSIRKRMNDNLEALKAYNEAMNALENAENSIRSAHNKLVNGLSVLANSLGAHFDTGVKTTIEAHIKDIESKTNFKDLSSSAFGNSTDITAVIVSLQADLEKRICTIETKQGSHTWSTALAKVDKIFDIREKILMEKTTLNELNNLNQALSEQANFISREIRDEVQSKLDTIQLPMNQIYKEIQGNKAANIRLKLPNEDETNQQRLHIVIDFSTNSQGVQPSGYLSDSQIHSVALALRLATIKELNRDAPFVALDDVVTSYDADHRRSIVSMIEKMFSE